MLKKVLKLNSALFLSDRKGNGRPSRFLDMIWDTGSKKIDPVFNSPVKDWVETVKFDGIDEVHALIEHIPWD